jgi:hypothetical protein
MDPTTVRFIELRLAHALHAVFSDLVRYRIDEMLDHGMSPEMRRASIRMELREAFLAGADRAALKKIARDLYEAYACPTPVDDEDRQVYRAVMMNDAITSIMRIWFNALTMVRSRVQLDLTFLALLDDAMLPPMDPATTRTCLAHTLLTSAEVRTGLRELRDRMPAGAMLHPDAAVILGIKLPEVMQA